MQAWGERGRFVAVRDTAPVPTKSGVCGLLCAALGAEPETVIELQRSLAMGVRVDQPGTVTRDFHTVKTGTLAAGGGVRGGGDDPMTLVSNRFYLCGASFLVALMGEPDLVERLGNALFDPVFPLFLGRMCCIPSAPILVGSKHCRSLRAALGEGRIEIESEPGEGSVVRMDTILSVEHRAFAPRYVRREGDGW